MTAFINIPNVITLLRILAVPALVDFILYQRLREALLLFIVLSFSDALDGAIARVFKQKTTLGTILDPLADKALVISTFVSLTALGLIPLWLTVIVLSRDLILLVGGLVIQLMTGRLKVIPSGLGKITTFSQLLTVFLVLATSPGMSLTRRFVLDGTGLSFLATALLSVSSGVHYTYLGLLQLQPEDRAAPRKMSR